jgi:hypothetical protein
MDAAPTPCSDSPPRAFAAREPLLSPRDVNERSSRVGSEAPTGQGLRGRCDEGASRDTRCTSAYCVFTLPWRRTR